MFDVKANFKTIYQGILHHPLCKIDEESSEHIFVCPDGLICKFGDNDSDCLDNLLTFLKRTLDHSKTGLAFAEI